MVTHFGLDATESLEVDHARFHLDTFVLNALEVLCLQPALPLGDTGDNAAHKHRLHVAISADERLAVRDESCAAKFGINLVQLDAEV